MKNQIRYTGRRLAEVLGVSTRELSQTIRSWIEWYPEKVLFGTDTSPSSPEFGWEEQGWIGNTEMRVLHDTGVVGLLVFILFAVSLVYRAWKALKLEPNPALVALLASLLVYCITFQATEGTLLAFSWVHLGLIGCAISVMNGVKHSIEEGKTQIASN